MNNLSEMKARQSTKIRQLAKAANIDSLEEFASALNIPRSTAWTIRTGQHKASGLTASIVERMLAAPKLPSATRATLLEYVAEKASGLYGSTGRQRRDIRRKMKERK
jgi:hypothetical protein